LLASLGEDWAGDHPFRVVELGEGIDPKGSDTVTVTLDGSLVGWLTPKMTARFRPAVETTQVQVRRLIACATLEPSKRKGCESEVDVLLRLLRGWGLDFRLNMLRVPRGAGLHTRLRERETERE
jgi:hypothetical protein